MLQKVLKFSANWCIPCKKLQPEFQELKQEFSQVNFEEIDIDKNQDLTEKYLVRNIPTVILLDENNKILSRIVGYAPEKIKESIQNNLK